jgi:hypothetical protein
MGRRKTTRAEGNAWSLGSPKRRPATRWLPTTTGEVAVAKTPWPAVGSRLTRKARPGFVATTIRSSEPTWMIWIGAQSASAYV